jgi:hypothetical protein
MKPTITRGRIDYIHNQRGEIGREWFTITRFPGGDRTVRALCEMDEDGILRDVTHSVDAAWKPLDAFVRLSLHGQLSGSAWFAFSETGVTCEARTRGEGRVSQTFATEGWLPVFAPHPLACDGWQAAALLEKDLETVTFTGANCSPLPNGGSGPLLGIDRDKTLTSLGAETITVPAGAFDAWRFSISLDEPGFDPIHVWVRRPDYLLIKAEWGLLDSVYVLSELDETG